MKWFRDKSARDRANEEKEILEEEIGRCVRFFRCMENVWISMAKKSSTNTPGHASYAYKQAEMYDRLAKDSADVQVRMEEKKRLYDKWSVRLINLWGKNFLIV